MKLNLPKDWPRQAREYVMDLALQFALDMRGQWPDRDALIAKAVRDFGHWADRQTFKARPTWIARYEDGELDVEIEAALDAFLDGINA